MHVSGDPRSKAIVLVGFMASGKSTVGALLAERLRLDFVDTDQLVEEEFGMPIADIFKRYGERAFREAERRAITSIIDHAPMVIAAGGGTFLDATTRRALDTSSVTIWLDPPFDFLRERLQKPLQRPLAAARTEEQLRELWEERRPIYALADLQIPVARHEPSHLVDEIIGRLAHL